MLAVSLLVFDTAASTASRRAPQTLVASPQPIYAVAQSAVALAWIGRDGRVRMERFGHKERSVIGRVDPLERASSSTIAVAGTRALWSYDSGGNSYEISLTAGGLGLKAAGVALLHGGLRGYGDGERFAGLGSDASTLAFSVVDETCVGVPYNLCEDLCNPVGSCPLTVTGGGVFIPTPTLKPSQVPAVPPPALFALAGEFVAIAPARSPVANVEPVPRVVQDGPVEVYDRKGVLLARIPLQGLVRGLALSGHKLAVLLEEPAGNRVVIVFDARTGSAIAGGGRLSLAATSISIASGRVVFRVGRQIYLLRSEARPLLLARAASTPVGLSLVGRRVVWAENVHGHGRINAVMLR